MQVHNDDTVNKNWLILDSYYTNSCAKNETIVSNITVIPPEKHHRSYINGVHTEYTMKGTLNIYPMIIYANDNSMANTLSLKEVESYFCMTMDTNEDHATLVQ